MRVAYLINQYPMPSHTFIRSEIRELERQGVEIERVSMRGWENHPISSVDREEQERTTYILQRSTIRLLLISLSFALSRPRRFLAALSSAISLARSGGEWTRNLAYLIEACWLARWSKGRVQHIHAHFGTNTAAIALIVSKLADIPFSFTVHGPEEFDRPLALNLEAKIRGAAFVVAITSFCRSQLFRWARQRDWTKIQLVHCAPDREFLAPPRTAQARTQRLVCVGRLCEQKGQLLLVQALAELRDRQICISLVLAGDGPMRAEIEREIDRLEIGPQVRITGWIGSDEVKSELLAADALILPSFAEGLPIVIMEAMALGRPVISTYVAGIPELVRPAVDGYLVPAGDVAGLADAIREFYALEQGEVERMSNAAQARVRQRHDPQVEASKLKKLFISSLASGR